jgi:hypothetical protein
MAATNDLHTAGLDFRLATSSFRGSNNLELAGFLLWNTDPGDRGDTTAYGVQLDYPNDRWVGRMGFAEIPPNHNPAIGFTQRRGFRGYSPQLLFAPRPEGHPWIRQFTFGADAEVKTDMENRTLTRTVDLTLFQVNLHSQEAVQVHLIPSYERLDEDFEIHPGIVLPFGRDYHFTRYRIQAGTANRRVIAVNSSFEGGSFLSGDRQEVIVNVGIRPRPGIRLNVESEWNRVDLPEGRFETRLARLISDTQFSPWIYLVNNLQYDSVSRGLGWQFRLRWILDPGNDLYFVYQQNWRNEELLERFVTQDRRGAAKFIYTYRY